MRNRANEAKQNLSNWESLLQDAKELLGRSKSIESEVEDKKDDIERSWADTSREISSARSETSRAIDNQRTDTRKEISTNQSNVSDPPRPDPSTPIVHGDVTLPEESNYEIPSPIQVFEVEQSLSETREKPSVERERPAPFTERDWFKVHSDHFPISEDVFSKDRLTDTAQSDEPESGSSISELDQNETTRDSRSRGTDREDTE